MSTPADYLFNQFNDPLADAASGPQDPLGPPQQQQQQGEQIDPVNFMSSYVSGSLGPAAKNTSFSTPDLDFTAMQQYRTQRRGVKADDPFAMQQFNAQFKPDSKMIGLTNAADQMERGAQLKLYSYFLDQGLKHKEALAQATYLAQAQTDELLSDPNFSNAFAADYSSRNQSGQPAAPQAGAGGEAGAGADGEGLGVLGTIAARGAEGSALLTQAVMGTTAGLVGADGSAVAEGIKGGAGKIAERIAGVANKTITENVKGFFNNLYYGVSAEIQYGIPQAYYGGAFLLEDYFGNDEEGVSSEAQQYLDKYTKAETDKQSYFQENDINPESLGVGIGGVIPAFVGGAGLGSLAKTAITRGIGMQVGVRAQSFISASPMSAYVGGSNYAQVREDGANKNQALGYAALTGSAAIVAESLPFGSLLKRFNVAPGTKGVLAKLAAGEKVGAAQAKAAIGAFLKQGTTELTEETMEEMIDVFGQVGILDRDATEVIRDSIAPYMGQTVPVSFLFGAFLGAGTSPLSVRRAKNMGKMKLQAEKLLQAGNVSDANAAKIIGEASLGSTKAETGPDDRVDLSVGAGEPSAQASQLDADVAERTALENELTQVQLDIERLENDPSLAVGEGSADGGPTQQLTTLNTKYQQLEAKLGTLEDKITLASTAGSGRETAGEQGGAPGGAPQSGSQVQTQPGVDAEEGAGDLGVYAQEVSALKATQREMELSDAALEEVYANRGDIMENLNPAEQEQFKMAGALQGILSPAMEAYAQTIAETNPEAAAQIQELAGAVASGGDVAIASLLATGNKEVPSLITAISRNPGTPEAAKAIERLTEVLGGVMSLGQSDIIDTDNGVAQASIAYTKLNDKITAIENGELTGPTPSVVDLVNRAEEGTGSAADAAVKSRENKKFYNATRVAANGYIARILETIPGDTPLTQEVVDQMYELLQNFPRRFAGSSSAINMLKSELDFLSKAQKEGKMTVDSLFQGVRDRLGSGSTSAIDSTEQRLAFSQTQADTMAASLNISGVSSFSDLQQVANDPNARAKDRAVAKRVVDAVVSRDISEVVTENFDVAENVASVDINQVINDLISSGRVNSFEQAIGQLERGTTNGKNSDDIFSQLVLKDSEKQAKRRLKSEAVGADVDKINTFDEVRGRVYQKSGVLNDAVTESYTNSLLDTFLNSKPMAKYGIANQSGLNEALLGSDGNAIRKQLNTFLDARLTGANVPARTVRDSLRDIAKTMGTAQEDAVSLEIQEIDKIVADLSKAIGQPVTVDLITTMLLQYSEESGAKVETITTRFLRAFKSFSRKKTTADIRNDSDPRMYYGWALSRIGGSVPRRDLALMASDVIKNGAEYMSMKPGDLVNGITYGLNRRTKDRRAVSTNKFVAYMQKEFDKHRGKHPANETVDAAFLAKIFSDMAYGPQEGIVGEDGTVFNANEHAQQLNSKVRKLGRTQEIKEDEVSYWANVSLGFLSEEDLFGKDMSVSASHMQAIKQLLALNGSPVAADMPVLFLTPEVDRSDAAQQIRLLIKGGMLRDRANHLQKTRHEFTVKQQIKMLSDADSLLGLASRTEKKALLRLEKYVGSPSSRFGHRLFEDTSNGSKTIPGEALIEETYRSTSNPDPGMIDYRGGSATQTLRILAQRLGVLPTAHASYSNLRRDPALVRSIFDGMFQDLVADPTSLLTMDPEFLGVVESVYGIAIKTNGDEVFIEKVAPVSSIADSIKVMSGRITYLTDNINLLRGLRNDKKAKRQVQLALEKTFSKTAMISPAIDKFLKDGKTSPGMRQGTIDSILRYAMGVAAKKQDIRLGELLSNDITRSTIHGNLQLLMSNGTDEDSKRAARSYLTGVLSNGGEVGALVQTANTIEKIPEMRQLSTKITKDLQADFINASRDDLNDTEKNSAIENSSSAWADISGMALGINSLISDENADITPEMISSTFNIPLTQASAALRDSTGETISYLMNVTREGKNQDIFAKDLARGDRGAKGVMNLLAIGRISAQTGVNLTPGTIEMMGDVIENLNDFKGAANLLALFQTGHGRQMAQHNAITQIVQENMRGLQASMEAAEAELYTLSDRDEEASMVLRSTADIGPLLVEGISSMRSFMSNPEPVLSLIPEDQAKQAAVYAAERTAQGNELLSILDTVIGVSRTNPSLMDRESAVRAFVAASEFFKSGERTQVYNWMSWAYTQEGKRALLNDPSAMPSSEILNKTPDSLAQAAELLGSRFGVNSVAIQGLGSIYSSAFSNNKKIDVDGKMMTVDEIQDRLASLWREARNVTGPEDLGIPVTMKETGLDTKTASLYGARSRGQSVESKAARERARLYQALEDAFEVSKQELNGEVTALLDLAYEVDTSSIEFNEQLADMANLLVAGGRVEAAISLLNRMPLDAKNITFLAGLKLNAKVFDGSNPAGQRVIDLATSERIGSKIKSLYRMLKGDSDRAALSFISSQVVSNELDNAGLNYMALDPTMAMSSIHSLIARNGFSLAGEGGGEPIPGQGGKVTLATKKNPSWRKNDSETVWLSLLEAHLRNGYVSSSSMARAAKELNLGNKEILTAIFSGGDINEIAKKFTPEHAVRARALLKAARTVQENLSKENFAFRDMQMVTAALDSEASVRLEDQISPAAKKSQKLNGLGILIEALEWSFKNDPRFTNVSPNLKLDFGAEIIDLSTVVDKDGNRSNPGVKRLKEALKLVKSAGRNQGDVKQLQYDLKLMVVQSMYANHGVEGRININQTLAEVITNYSTFLIQSTDVNDVGSPEAVRRTRHNTRRMNILGGLIDSMAENIRAAGLPDQTGLGEQVAVTLEKTAKAIPQIVEYRARWREEIARNGGRAAVRRSQEGNSRVLYLSGAFSLESLYAVLDNVSNGTGIFQADSIEILSDFMPPPEVAMGLYSFSGELEGAAGRDQESPLVRRRIESLTKIGASKKVDPLETIYQYIQDSGPGMEKLFRKKVLDKDFADLNGKLELEMSSKGQRAYVHTSNNTLEEVGFTPRPGPKGFNTQPAAPTPTQTIASSNLPDAPTTNKAQQIVSESKASQLNVSDTLERAADESTSLEIREAWQDTLEYNGGSRAIANRIEAYAAELESQSLSGTNDKLVAEIRALASNMVSNTLAAAELTNTNVNSIVGGLNFMLALRENAPTINGINFTAQHMRPAGLAEDFTYMMESGLLENIIEVSRGGTDEDVINSLEEFKEAFPTYGTAIVNGIGTARQRREGGSSPGFPQGETLGPNNSQGSNKAKASLASVTAPARGSEDLVVARRRVEKELDRGQVGVLATLEKKGIVHIVLNTSDVPADVLSLLAPGERSSTRLQAVTAPDGRVFLIAKNLPVGAAWPVLLHEVGVHVGFEQMLGKPGLAEIANLVIDRAKQGDWVAQQAMSRFRAAAVANPKLNDRRDPASNHEIVAYFVETQAGTPMSEGILDKLLSMVRRWVFDYLGASAKVLSNKDIMQLAYSAMRRANGPTIPPIAKGRPDNFEPRTNPAAAALKMPSTPETGRLDTGGGVSIDVKPPQGEKQQRGKKYYTKRDSAVLDGQEVEEANVESSPRKQTPLEFRKEVSKAFADKSSTKMVGFVTRFVDAMSPARRAMDKVASVMGVKDIPAAFNFVMQTILGVDKHAATENMLDNEILPQIRAITENLKKSLASLPREDGRKWSEDNILQLINHRIEALAAKEQNEAYVMFQAPLAPLAHAARAKVLEQWKAGSLDNLSVRRSIVKIFNEHKQETGDYPVWLEKYGKAGSGVDAKTIGQILNAEQGAFSAGAQQFAQLDGLVSRIQQHTMELLTEAGHIDATLLPLYGFKYYVPLTGSVVAKERGGDEIAKILTGTRAMVAPSAWNNKSSELLSDKPEEGMRGDAMDRMFLWAMDASQIKAENDTAQSMFSYGEEYNDTPAGRILRVNTLGTSDYIEVRDGVLQKTKTGRAIDGQLKENEFVLRRDGRVTLLEIDTSTTEGQNTSLAVKGTWRTSHPGNEIMPDAASNVMIGGGRLMASLFTRYNPFFWGRAMLRDSQTYGAILTNEFGVGTAANFTGEMAVMMASRLGVGTLGTMSKEISRIENGKAPTTEMGQDYQVLLNHGAVTSRTRMLSQEGRNLAVSEAFEGKFARAAKGLGTFLSTVSQGAEMIPRIAAFRAFKSSGMDEQTAAFHSKRLMDFSQRGTDIQSNSLMTTWFLFLRPALTGSARILESFEQMTKDNPVRAAAITSMWIGMGAFMAMLSHYLTDDDDEELWLGQNPDDMMFGLKFPGKSFGLRRDVQVPFGYGIGWFFGIGANLYKGQVKGDYSDVNFGLLGKGAARHFTPFEWQGSAVKTVMNLAMPDVMAPFAELATNENRWGYKIYKERPSVPDYLDAKSHTGELWLDASSTLNTLGESLGFGSSWSISPDAIRSFAGMVPPIRTITDIISLGQEGSGMDALTEAAGQLVGVTGSRAAYYSSAWDDLKMAKEEADQEITRINYLGHGASAKDITNLSSARRLSEMVGSIDKKLKKLYKFRQETADQYVQNNIPKDKEAIERIDSQITRLKAAAANLGLLE